MPKRKLFTPAVIAEISRLVDQGRERRRDCSPARMQAWNFARPMFAARHDAAEAFKVRRMRRSMAEDAPATSDARVAGANPSSATQLSPTQKPRPKCTITVDPDTWNALQAEAFKRGTTAAALGADIVVFTVVAGWRGSKPC
jgi:hypothetical protein